jgi:hypothetical protein
MATDWRTWTTSRRSSRFQGNTLVGGTEFPRSLARLWRRDHAMQSSSLSTEHAEEDSLLR